MDAARRDWIDLVVLNDAPLVLQFEAVQPNMVLYASDDFEPGVFSSKVIGCTGTSSRISEENGYVNEDMAETGRGMIGFCNVLVHDYVDIDSDRVYDVLQHQLDDIRRLRRVFGHFL